MQLLLKTPSIASCFHSPLDCCLLMISLIPFSIGVWSGYCASISPIHAHAVCTTCEPVGCSMYIPCSQDCLLCQWRGFPLSKVHRVPYSSRSILHHFSALIEKTRSPFWHARCSRMSRLYLQDFPMQTCLQRWNIFPNSRTSCRLVAEHFWYIGLPCL